ncbi:tRNA 2-thiouridine(34) synthase MnmA [Corynebacterium urealyticum]|uniref:tRNA 2-thiouridine(34) synthase MnmA n=1 Tax=Corynebacterium urealyticum TaxID=43771 RepID=UPI0002B3FE0D|nr:tRNA 2-thiouridine(34) synthase MnmA [Corynebacterium urealyticum]AGE36310.1 tRNA (5-methylaminomethyl-2-thiouridylate)-methyltransferase [Corynebacterium urealyticum DSM 7111]QQB07977.1 tRNA 2-thiouridine(34) synthase MnmA [Corynebacterium urealyticum]QQE50457.1 tRNA 2-thiouridine(34) synthase MnmA [Corynebacterium urealyticum]TYR15809.1 tRNA 2-thiouridine(34) synthase MnmA [Corynebacterium urealyticum]TYR18193.1 tRNA 2-thiouridine(34) synthase MnmA [Corynebacterium urealyticum]
MRVVAAMSGGVDSAVAAARALEAGHEVIGVHLALSQSPEAVRAGSRGCCSLEDSADARRVADKLGIPFYVWDFSDRFKADVIDNFVDSYAIGETPNPCLRCNEKIKFEALLDRSIALGFDAVVTGHYAQLHDGVLRRGVDADKDQSYVLGVLTDEQLAHCMFPVGDTVKPEIREEAADAGFGVANKPDSHDICFIPDGKTQAFLGSKIGLRPGLVRDTGGETVAEHDGVYGFTVGQRKGLGLPRETLDGRPRYVTDIDAHTGTVTVGTREDLRVGGIIADRLKRLDPEVHGREFDCEVQVRAHGGVVPARARLVDDPAPVTPAGRVKEADELPWRLELELLQPLEGVARGQAAVVYRPDEGGDILLGSGTIRATTALGAPIEEQPAPGTVGAVDAEAIEQGEDTQP